MTRRDELQDEHSVERELLARYRQQREKALLDLADAQARAERYDKAVTGLEAVLPDEDSDPNPAVQQIIAAIPRATGDAIDNTGPRGEAAVARVLQEAGPAGLSPSALAAALAERGWRPNSDNPENAVRAAANRLRKKDERFFFMDGIYRYREVIPEQQDAANGDQPSLIQNAVKRGSDERTGKPPG